MKKMKTYGVWMDHSKAIFIDLDASKENFTVNSSFNHTDKVETLSRSEKTMHNKEQHQQLAYFKEIKDRLENCNRLLLFGPTSAKMEFYNFIKENGHLKDIAIETTDKMSMNELHAYVHKHYQNQITQIDF
jgi:stalled ribosome rescue protein Dom34